MASIYLDYASAAPVDKRVFEFAKKYLLGDLGNPSSIHSSGLEAKRAIEESRQKVAGLINAEKDNTIIFTSGATEANNLAVRGTAQQNVKKGRDICASAIEHISILNTMKELTKEDFNFSTIPVDQTGLVDLEKLKELVTKNTTITSIMYANNEIGTIQPIKEISDIIHDKGSYLHVDATAAAGKISIDVQKEGIDLLTLSSNDLYGPQGVGALYLRPGIRPKPLCYGGGQERGLRSGTENVFGIAGMGEAARLVKDEMSTESERLKGIRDELIPQVLELDETFLTGHSERRLPHHASFRFSKIEGESILLSMDMQNIRIATGSACTSKTLEPSHVLLAIGLKHEEAHGSMVITLGPTNTKDDIPVVVKAVRSTVERLRSFSPM